MSELEIRCYRVGKSDTDVYSAKLVSLGFATRTDSRLRLGANPTYTITPAGQEYFKP